MDVAPDNFTVRERPGIEGKPATWELWLGMRKRSDYPNEAAALGDAKEHGYTVLRVKQ